jgi:hypothetical protein
METELLLPIEFDFSKQTMAPPKTKIKRIIAGHRITRIKKSRSVAKAFEKIKLEYMKEIAGVSCINKVEDASEYYNSTLGGVKDAEKTVEQRQEESHLTHLLRLKTCMIRLAHLYDETDGRLGARLEYHQWIPVSAGFLGFALNILGEIGLARHRDYLADQFNFANFDTKMAIKFGRRAGKSFALAIFVAILLITQPDTHGFFVNLDGKLAAQNKANVLQVLRWILEDPKQSLNGAHIVSTTQDSIIVRSVDGTDNIITFTPDPTKTIRSLLLSILPPLPSNFFNEISFQTFF